MVVSAEGRADMTEDQALLYASGRHGMSAPVESATKRIVARLLAAGRIERRERTVWLPAFEGRHAHAMGLERPAGDVTIVTYHRVGAP